METKHKITIPKPCHEDWNKMTPDETGRFCNSCSKSVVDFTQMQANEIQDFFILNQNKSICGRFKNSQLDEIIIQIPSRVLYSQTQYHRIFILALFICMGTTLFSCKQENGTKQKIDKIEVIKDTTKFEMISVGKTKANPNDSTHIPPPPPKMNQLKLTKTKPCLKIPLNDYVTSGDVQINEIIEVDTTKKENKEAPINFEKSIDSTKNQNKQN